MFYGINAIEFGRVFTSNEDCLKYLSDMKWANGYSCKVCGFDQYKKGRTSYHKRCKGCLYDESPTANTLFHDLRIPMIKAFFMLFRLTTKKKGMSTMELAGEVGVQQKTAWLFKRKVQVAMKNASSAKLSGNVEVDEFLVGGRQPKGYGRKATNKKAAIIAIEKLDEGKVGNLYIRPIEDFKADTLKFTILEGVDAQASIKTDEFISYETIAKDLNISRVKSDKGKNFIELHQQILLFKMWLRGIHHKCSTKHYHAYCDEYNFRFNNRNQRKTIFSRLLNTFIHLQPHPYPVLSTLSAYST